MRFQLRSANVRLSLLALAVFTLSFGCERRPADTSPLGKEDAEHVLVIIFDLSESFASYMNQDGPAFSFALKTIDQYFRARIGTRDKIILARISASGQPLLFEGTPQELRKQFPDAVAFSDFLRRNVDPNGSQVYAGVTRTVEYLREVQRTKYPNAKGLLLVLSDLVDTNSADKAAAQGMLTSLAEYGSAGGAIGFYFVAPEVAPFLDKHLHERGVRDARVESNIVRSPLVPLFD